MRIGRLIDQSDWRNLVPAIETIFFATSSVQTFADVRGRETFRMRWLGRYMVRFAEDFFVARDRDGAVIGYLAGCVDNPALDPLFDDIPYYKTFAVLCVRYPAHLHINMDGRFRSRGIGGALIEAFAAHASRAGAPGMHIVTSKGARNVHFYERTGFRVLGQTQAERDDVVFMGRLLPQA
jgi:GNAT superfamily N-acetyltransferase